jgi:methylated-DNA-protein-cysteine methyltransferase-like protein
LRGAEAARDLQSGRVRPDVAHADTLNSVMATGMFDLMLKTVRRIPKGKVATYGDVAAASGYPRAARQVVWALRAGRNVPWHRVLGARGVIRLTGEPGLEQKLRLRLEKVVVSGNRVDLKQFGHTFRKLH